ncbi:hypothetical protein PPYR_07262 [Photinus pyralis]|uniref:Caprin-1 dimerization domain-containing protein n=2 Tax=Photinus pyralis TaxID=7054 RepID=A0A1Y1L598_PHOPY|nr:caprin homolog [Photinus pyralis]KAB0799382.1 hypothetical protein PPYR_07262 [Photinus pyralis]
MPSAANVKIEKQINSDTTLPDCTGTSVTPLRQAITIIEHKIRNLEKRKSKLESYRQLQDSGKDLNQDQKTAIAKYEEVVQTLEFARDLCKQFVGIAAVSEKEAKKQARKEVAAKSHSELAKIREVLLVQDALNQMGQDSIRDDFLLGQNGAANLTNADLKMLDDLYPVVTPKHEPGDATAFANQVQAAAEHLLAVVDGKQKEVFDGSYSQIKEVIGKIHESGYFDQAVAADYETTEVNDADQHCNIEVPQQIEPLEEEIPAVDTVTIETNRPVPLPIEHPLEQIQQTDQQIYYQPPPRPISEVLGPGSFHFLQDSELDTPDTLPSQTFTNTSYVQAPPPPIPLPPNFQTFNNINVPPPGNGMNEEIAPPSVVAHPQPQQIEESQKMRGQPPRPPNQMYYQNNHSNSNNYNNNRPRQPRSGPRTANRHQ